MSKFIKLGVIAIAGITAIKCVSLFGDYSVNAQDLGARDVPESVEGAKIEADQASSQVGNNPPNSGNLTATTGTLPEILAALAAERTSLDERKAQLDARESRINLARDAVLDQTTHLEALQASLEAQISQAGDQNAADMTKLISIYKAMKPAQAAAIFNDADLELSVLVLSEMDARSSGPIIATMSPVRARAISKIILERSRLPGDQKLVGIQLN